MRRTLIHSLLVLAMTGATHGIASAAANAPLLEAARNAEPVVIESLKSMVMIESGSADAAGLARMADLRAALPSSCMHCRV